MAKNANNLSLIQSFLWSRVQFSTAAAAACFLAILTLQKFKLKLLLVIAT